MTTPHSHLRALAESFRVRLGFQPWDEHERAARDIVLEVQCEGRREDDGGRRSGRTTRGLLASIAACVLSRHDTLYIEAAPTSNCCRCIDAARDMIGRLELPIRVGPCPDNMRGMRSATVYVDHHRIGS